MRTSFTFLAVLLACAPLPLAHSETLAITTLAGFPGQGSADGAGAAARFANPWGVAADSSGNLYVADTDNHTIRKITIGGGVSILAGVAGVSGSVDGTGGGALFYQPQGVAVDAAGNIYVADTGNHTIRKITSLGTVTTLAGLAGNTGSTDASGSSARFYEPEGIAVNSAGTLIYVADTWNHTIRQITSAGAVSTLAGSAGNYGTNNGTGTSAQFNQPQGIAVDGAGNLYIGDTGNQMIRKVTSAGVVTILAGSSGNYGSTDATGSSASFWGPQSVALDGSTNLYVADSFNNTIRRVTPAGVVTTLAGTAGAPGTADGTGTAARFWQPQGVALDSAGNIFVADSANGTIRKIASGAVVTTLAGSPSTGSADGTGGNARFYGPCGAAIDGDGNSYVADTANGTIRKITVAGVVSTLAGSAGNFGSTDATGSSARFNCPQGIALDTSGNAYVADTANHTIRKITSGGAVTTLAGSAGTNGIADGSGSNARFNAPQGLTVDISGNVFVADTWNHTIRKVTAAGVVTTLAGLPGYYGNLDSGTTGNGTNVARFSSPSGVAVDVAGNVFVADTGNHAIRKVTSAGVVSTLAGLPGVWGSDDGTNASARFYLPQDIAVDASGNLYVLDSGNHTLRVVAPVGTNWVVTTVAGMPDVTGSADGTGNNARFCYPAGIGMNNVGTLSIADWGNNTIRAGGLSTNISPSILAQPQPQTVGQGQTGSFSVVAAGSAPLSYQWLLFGTNLPSATASSYTCANAQPANAGPYSVIVSNFVGSVTSSPALLTVVMPPVITDPPQGLTVDQNISATFTVTASGTAPFAYQWLFNGAAISTATSSSYTRTNTQPEDAGSYSVIISNYAGSITSAPALLTVNLVPTPPSITAQPQSQAVAQGLTGLLAVTVIGSTPLSYQWLFYGTNLNGATFSSYGIPNAQPPNAGPYAVIITNAYGAVTSATATLTVVLPPIISVQPTNQFRSVSNNVTFTVGLSQGTSPAYQWRQNGTPISGATQASLTLNPLTWGQAGTYSVVVTNIAGSATSANATLVLQQAPCSFFDGFESYSLGILDNNFGGPNAVLSNPWWALSSTTQGTVTNLATGVVPHTGVRMAGRTGSSYLQDYFNLNYRLNAGQPYYGNFMCEWWFYDPYGTTSLVNATNYVDYMALCSFAPVSATNDYYTTTWATIYQRMSLGAYNTSGFNVSNYQARIINGAGSFGSGNSWYNTTTPRAVGWHHARIVVGIPNASNYAPVWMYIDNMFNPTVASPTAGTNTGFNLIEMNHANGNSGYYDDLTFRAANDPWIVEQPVGQSAAPGQPASFTTVAVGTGFQWQFNGNNISGATSSTYTIASVAATNFGNYACVITGTNGTVTTSPAMLTVTGPPAIVGQPGSMTVSQGQIAAFGATATGTTPFSWQWQFNSAPISGATGTSYTIPSAQPTNAGSYSVIVTNAWGGVTSAVATLTVRVPPSISAQPGSLIVTQSQNATFSVTAAGTAPLACQWRFNSALISGATGTSYTVTNTQPADAGSYTVAVTNMAGSITSSVATLTVLVPPSIGAQPQSQSVLAGNCATLSVGATGTAPLYYQWQWNGVLQAGGAALSSYAACNAGSYSVVITNAAGSVTSAVATVTVLVPPAIVTQPVSQSVTQDQQATFSVTADGTAPLAYQWQFNGASIAGATLTSFILTNAQSADAGSYEVIVTNVVGSVTSSVATLTVLPPPPAPPVQFDSLSLLEDGSLQLSMSGAPYTNYVLEITADWTHWDLLATLSSTNGLLEYNDPSVGTNAQRFYRLRAQP
jgi:sugar lactone lactonase YvrE